MGSRCVMAEPQVIQVLMHGALLRDFEVWLNSRRLEIHRTPFLDDPEDTEGILPTYLVTPSAMLMREVMDREVDG